MAQMKDWGRQQQAYNQTQPEECFATGDDAQRAGYRPAQQ